jgi:hypothetical protein
MHAVVRRPAQDNTGSLVLRLLSFRFHRESLHPFSAADAALRLKMIDRSQYSRSMLERCPTATELRAAVEGAQMNCTQNQSPNAPQRAEPLSAGTRPLRSVLITRAILLIVFNQNNQYMRIL